MNKGPKLKAFLFWPVRIAALRMALLPLMLFLLATNEGSGPTEPEWLNGISNCLFPESTAHFHYPALIGGLFNRLGPLSLLLMMGLVFLETLAVVAVSKVVVNGLYYRHA